jgi:hypothetical protein
MTDHPTREALIEALTPGGATKLAYIGDFKFNAYYDDEQGEEAQIMVVVPWTTTKEIMAAIMRRATSESSRELNDD